MCHCNRNRKPLRSMDTFIHLRSAQDDPGELHEPKVHYRPPAPLLSGAECFWWQRGSLCAASPGTEEEAGRKCSRENIAGAMFFAGVGLDLHALSFLALSSSLIPNWLFQLCSSVCFVSTDCRLALPTLRRVERCDARQRSASRSIARGRSLSIPDEAVGVRLSCRK